MTLKTKLVAAGAMALALGGAGAALAGAGPGKGHGPLRESAFAMRGGAPGFGLRAGGPVVALQGAADYLGIPLATLRTDLESGKTLAQVADATSGKSAAGLVSALVADARAKLDAAVTAGKLTQTQADAFAARLQQGITSMVNGTRPARPAGPLGMGPGRGDDLQAAADYLGIPLATLRTDLQSGETLAQVAGATSGKSAAGLIAALVAHETSELDAAVKAGKLTQAQMDAITANLQQRVTDRVNGTRPARPAGPRGHGGTGHGWGKGRGWGKGFGGGVNA